MERSKARNIGFKDSNEVFKTLNYGMSDHANKTREELERLIADNRNKLQAFRFAMAGSKQKNVKEGKGLRKEIARLLTELYKRTSEARKPNR